MKSMVNDSQCKHGLICPEIALQEVIKYSIKMQKGCKVLTLQCLTVNSHLRVPCIRIGSWARQKQLVNCVHAQYGGMLYGCPHARSP
jgi:hypothetical protein